MNYTEEQLCEIYYLFHEHDSKCIEDIKNKYPELLKYERILRHLCFELEIFKGEYTIFFGGKFKYTGPEFSNHHNISIYAMRELFKILSNIPEDQLCLVNDNLLMRISFVWNHLYIDKYKSILTPSHMAEDNLHEYLCNFRLMLSKEMHNNSFKNVEYNGLKLIENKKMDYIRYANNKYQDSYRTYRFIDMILAYFYSHLEKYDYNYDNLDLLINNFEERALEYINEFDTIYGKRYDILGGRMISDMEVYEYISSIVDKLLSEKNIIRRLQ